ncbi:MAG TPA: glycerophosphodiester phosphodiesterase family protein [Saprospiraceae bacterium]|nr:glycerophosphodiester phosphodiesterase family protein [Saprospiraceae bacterium]HMQ83471.1 glycerophosphodiester phosphodiesterase family protein [Saprospiraceae bacterium]
MKRTHIYLLIGIISSITACMNPKSEPDKTFDWQGHRGARGLLPENTVPAFLKALEFPEITTLELDLAVSKDSQLVVSHEPWLSHQICSHPDGRPVLETEADSLLIWQMPYDQIRQYDCGSRGNARFPEQASLAVHKPLLGEVLQAVQTWCLENQRPEPAYNIEIKSMHEWDSLKTPAPDVFAALLVDALKKAGILERTCIQSFDVRALQAVQQLDPTRITALLVENELGLEENLRLLGFVPAIYSPYHELLSQAVVNSIHEKGMKVIPWTVNDAGRMQELIDMGVDGIITDYPDRIIK